MYHCCMSLDHAKAIERNGFEAEALVRVSDRLPVFADQALGETHAIIILAPAFDFKLADYPFADGTEGSEERLVPGRVLNGFPRATWPEA